MKLGFLEIPMNSATFLNPCKLSNYLRSALLAGAAATALLAPGSGRAMPATMVNGFMGHYDPANWFFDKGSGNGSVNLSGVPNSISLTGSSNGSNSPTDFFMGMPMEAGPVSFDWQYQSQDTATYDGFGYLLNGNFVALADSPLSSTEMFTLLAGDTFGFRVTTIDGTGAPGVVTISNFSAPDTAMPEEPAPGPLPLLGAAGAYGWSRRLRRRARQGATPAWE